MALRLENGWLWDFWLAADAGWFHLFYLHAPPTPSDPERRHSRAVIGHAVSSDLRTWEVLSDALMPGPAGSWDDATTWTGSVIQTNNGAWAMLYTGTSRAEDTLVQRIGLARSVDLVAWEKCEANPVLEADPTWYELLDPAVWPDQAWRDPCVVRDPATGLFHVFITARARAGPPAGRGVIGHAVSPDLEAWSVLEPIEAPRGYGNMEIPQVRYLGNRWHLLFSATASVQSGRRQAVTGVFQAASTAINGPYVEQPPLLVDARDRWYGGKVIEAFDTLWLLAFRYRDEAGRFVGELSEPMAVELDAGGTLRLANSETPSD